MKPRLAIAALALALAACGEQDLYTGLSQRQANEVTAALRHAGIDADKQQRDGNTFAVVAPRSRFADAVDLLRAAGLPRDGYDTLGQVFKKEGFVSSPLEERARLTYALSQEIANTLASMDGVVVARVHVSVPERDPLAEKAVPSSASVYLKHRPGRDFAARVGPIKALVVNALPGLPYDNVTVMLEAAEAAPVQPAAASAFGGLDTLLWALLATGVAAGLIGGAAWWWTTRRRAAPASGGALARVFERPAA